MNLIENILQELENEKNKYESLADLSNHDGYWQEDIEYTAKSEMCEEAKEIVLEVEKDYNNGWIPCSERLPSEEECQENDNRFIVTDGNRSYQRYFDYKEQQFVEPMHQNTFNTYYDRCVTAWQPLPVPYKEANNDRY